MATVGVKGLTNMTVGVTEGTRGWHTVHESPKRTTLRLVLRRK